MKYTPPPPLHLVLQEAVGAYRDLWKRTSGLSVAPAPEIILDLLWRYPEPSVMRAVEVGARKHGDGTLDFNQNWVGYLHAVARNPDFGKGMEE